MSGYALKPVPPARKDVLWVERIGGGEKHTFTVYSPAIWGLDTHYTPAGTKPCYEDHTLCEGGHKEETLRWKGYLHAWSHKRNKAVFVQLTEEGARELLAQVAEGVTFRGMRIEVSRTAHKKGRMHAEVLTWSSIKLEGMPPPLDPRKSVEALWKITPLNHLLTAKYCVNADLIPNREKVA